MARKYLVVAEPDAARLPELRATLAALREQQPSAHIDVLAVPALIGEIESMAADRCLKDPFNPLSLQWAARNGFAQALKAEGYSHALVLPDTLLAALVPFLAEIPERIGWRGAMRFWLINDIRLFSKRRYPTVLAKYLALLLPPASDVQAAFPQFEGRLGSGD